MDKYNLVLDIIENTENYTPQELAAILSDPETREIYNLLCTTDSAMEANGNDIDVDKEWKRFELKLKVRNRRKLRWVGNRAATIAAVICTSIVAVAAGIAVTVSVVTGKESAPVADSETATTYAVAEPDTVVARADSAMTIAGHDIMFENETLESIMRTVAETYGVAIEFNNAETASLHLYYRLDTALPLDEVISQLNTFDQINIQRKGTNLIID